MVCVLDALRWGLRLLISAMRVSQQAEVFRLYRFHVQVFCQRVSCDWRAESVGAMRGAQRSSNNVVCGCFLEAEKR